MGSKVSQRLVDRAGATVRRKTQLGGAIDDEANDGMMGALWMMKGATLRFIMRC